MLLARVRTYLNRLDGVDEKQIVGGIGFTWRGHLLGGVLADDLLVRIGKSDFPTFVAEPGARPMAMGARTSKGWILVEASAVHRAPAMAKWLDRAIGCVRSLPAK